MAKVLHTRTVDRESAIMLEGRIQVSASDDGKLLIRVGPSFPMQERYIFELSYEEGAQLMSETHAKLKDIAEGNY